MNKRVNKLIIKVILMTIGFIIYLYAAYNTISIDWGYMEIATRAVVIIGLIATLFIMAAILYVTTSTFTDLMYDTMAKCIVSGKMEREEYEDS